VEGRVFNDSIIRQGMAVFQPFTLKDEPLIIGRVFYLRQDDQLQIFYRCMRPYLGECVILERVRITTKTY
jgi:hypothetical protein